MKETSYYSKLEDKKVQCLLCPHHCIIAEGKSGICLTRINNNGILVSANYCRPVSTAIDPIEKKPLFHFYPGSVIFSTGPNGCNFKCSFCQNYEISQMVLDTREVSVRDIVTMVEDSGSIGIAYTYSEPYIWFETIMETGAKIRELGLKNVMVTNGYMEPEPLNELLKIADAMNIDIKSMNPDFYRRICKGSLDPVLRTCEQVKKAGCHLEITNLLITEENDSEKEMHTLTNYIAGNLGTDTPLHISRYFPRFKMEHPSTPMMELNRAWEIARDRLQYVYVGNVLTGNKEDTACPSCGALLIRRSDYSVRMLPELGRKEIDGTTYGICASCGHLTNIRL